ncbi:MAG: hypothetical protein IJQ39_10980 [Thermoguttaceae bacterium]|nr:hypothetical protein [Thermoguttaceae bacterium]
MIKIKFLTRLTASVSLLCLFSMSSLVFAQDAAPAPSPAPAQAPKPAAAATAPKPAQTDSGAKPAASKPLTFRFTDIEKDPDMDKMRSQTGSIINKGKFDKPEDKTIFEQYYKEYFFGRWINTGKYYQVDTYSETLRKQARGKKPAEKKKLETIASRWSYPCFIEDFRKDLDRSRSAGDPQKIAVKMAYDFAMEVIPNNNVQCTPAIKYNCVLLLGNLYYKTSSSSGDLPVAYAPAFDVLIKIASGAKMPRYMKIGAVMSLNQMIAETKLSDKQKNDAYTCLLAIAGAPIDPATFASSKDDPAGEGALWTRELAIEGLRLLADYNLKDDKTQGFYPKKEAIVALVKIINDKKAPMTTRIAAMESLGSYNFSKLPELNAYASRLQRAIAILVVDSIQAELDRKVDNLVWGSEADQLSRQHYSDDSASEPVDNTNNAIFLLQRAMPAIYAVNTALVGVKNDKGWKGLSDLGSASDKAKATEMTNALRDVNSSLNALSKEIMPSGDGSGMDTDVDEFERTDSLQEVTNALGNIQDTFKQFAE